MKKCLLYVLYIGIVNIGCAAPVVRLDPGGWEAAGTAAHSAMSKSAVELAAVGGMATGTTVFGMTVGRITAGKSAMELDMMGRVITGTTAVGSGHEVDSVVPMGLCLENYPYPYAVEYITLRLQGDIFKMAYMDVRPEHPNGHTILLLHGKNFCGLYWGPTARLLAGKGYRVIIPDQIGFGKSAKPERLQYTFALLAQNTRTLLDSVQVGKVIVLGHSMGGMIATRFTLQYPDRVEKLILEDPIGLEDWKLKVPYLGVDEQYKKELKQNYASLKKYELDGYFHGEWKPAYDEMLNVLAGWTLSPEYNRIAWNNALTSDMIFTQPVCYEFGGIKPPTLLIVGELDRTAIGKDLVPDSVRQTMGNYPVLGKLTQAKIPNCKLVILPGVGHVPHMEDFDAFARVLTGFLGS